MNQDDHPQDTTQLPKAARLRIRSTEMLLGVSPFTAVMHILVVGLVSWILWNANSPYEIVPWAIALSSFVLFQSVLVRRYGGKRFDPAKADQLLRLFHLGAIGVGLSWGFAGWFLFPVGQPGQQIFLTFVMGGMAMSAVSTQHVHIPTCVASVVPGMLPLAFRYLIEPGELSLVYGGLLIAYTIVLMTLMGRQWRFAMKAFHLQMENEELLDDVSRQAVELDLARRSAEAANAAKSRFLAQASHDLRQPLHAISLYVEALPIPAGESESGRIIGRVRQSLDVLSRLFNSLLDITLLDTGQIKVQEQVFRPSELVEQIRNEFAGVAEAANVDLRVRAAPLAIRSDPVLLRRMLQNLTSNALRHGEGGGVLLAVRRKDGGATVEVYDTGGGIPEKDQRRIFEEFTRLDPARMGGAAAPGLGLGLAIVKRLADVLGHGVELRSVENHGTRFRIAGLPLAPEGEATPLQDESIVATEDGLKNARVLLIDDDEVTLAAGRELLRKWGCDVETMTGWHGPPIEPPQIIICDYELSPGFTGFDAIDRLTKHMGGQPPAILISGNSSVSLRDAAKLRGIPLIHKPVRPGQLRSALLHVMASSRQPA